MYLKEEKYLRVWEVLYRLIDDDRWQLFGKRGSHRGGAEDAEDIRLSITSSHPDFYSPLVAQPESIQS